ncbi:hypothetical protein C1I97_08400 [Streptomyces sp. NTH33]|uniref:hypothetical protein n=1 Tax=Streptomyces sp. NTH33 TaxID=1735453 RepID=UPI000DA8BA90|nr:hypothetical protein [Streptomyces sp. NTH33]PZH15342.1 hypothetical protein C1I97_08400 [Streptomyces sp. NTH33]
MKYSGPGNIPLRQGYFTKRNGKESGFGWTKIKKKHAITKYGAIEFVTKGPNRKNQGGTSYKQWAYAGKYNCRNGVCRLVKQYKVIVAVQESKKHSGRDGKPKGVITGYCEGVIRCPAWVSTTLNKQNQGIAAETAPAVGETLRSGHEPLDESFRITVEVAATAADTFQYKAGYKPLADTGAAVRAAEETRYKASYSRLR